MWNPKIVPCFMVLLLLISNITLVKSNELKKLKKKVVKLEKKVDDTQVEIDTMKVGVSTTCHKDNIEEVPYTYSNITIFHIFFHSRIQN